MPLGITVPRRESMSGAVDVDVAVAVVVHEQGSLRW